MLQEIESSEILFSKEELNSYNEDVLTIITAFKFLKSMDQSCNNDIISDETSIFIIKRSQKIVNDMITNDSNFDLYGQSKIFAECVRIVLSLRLVNQKYVEEALKITNLLLSRSIHSLVKRLITEEENDLLLQ